MRKEKVSLQLWVLLWERKPGGEEFSCDELILAPSISSLSWNKGDSHAMNLLQLPKVSKEAWNE